MRMRRSLASPATLVRRPTKGYCHGTHRMVAPEATVAAVRPQLRRLGITRVADVTGLDWLGIPVIMVIRPNARSLAVSQGKGLTHAAAVASGLMEARELWYAERISADGRTATAKQLAREDAVVDLDGLPRVGPEPPDPERVRSWVRGTNLFDGKPTWVPRAVVSLDATEPAPSDGLASTSNGLASGNGLAEAVTHALCEVIERDALASWHAAPPPRRRARCVELRTVGDTACRELLDRCVAAGMEALVWEVSSRVPVPVFVCLLAEVGNNPARAPYASFGAGCHPDPGIALSRALTESAQARLTFITGSRDDLSPAEYLAGAVTSRRLAGYREARPPVPPIDFSALPAAAHDTFDEDLDWLLNRLARAGLHQPVLVKLSTGDEMPVVRVLVPGLAGPV